MKLDFQVIFCEKSIWSAGHDLNNFEFLIYTCTSFGVNLGISGAVVLVKIFFKILIPFLLFCDYLPFKNVFVFHFNNSKSPSQCLVLSLV